MSDHSDLIKRGDVYELACKWCEKCTDNPNYDCAIYQDHCAIIGDIDLIPTANAVEVVRCNDCKHFCGRNDKPGEATAIGYCENPHHFIMPCRYDFFCADGVRKEQRYE